MGRVVVGGLVTTLASLLAVFWFESQGTTVMGWYANHVIPIGALYVGFAASSGYGLASWLSGVKITRRVTLGLVALQVGAYFAACWLQFHAYGPVYDDGTPVSFVTWFDVSTRMFAFVQKDGTAGEAFGIWGYAFRALEVSGFCLGSLAAPRLLRNLSHCESCSLYMKDAKTVFVAATEYETAVKALDELEGFAQANQAGEFRDRLKELEIPSRDAKKQSRRITVTLMRCPSCECGELITMLWNGKNTLVTHTVSQPLGRSPLPRFFARDASA